MTRFRAGVDIGGTFTDLLFLGDEGTVFARKVLSTPDDFSRGVLDGLRQGIEELKIDPSMLTEVSHGFTVATNAILEQKGVRTALITTAGFRDVLELRRIRTPRLYDLYYKKPPTLVERRLRLEVRERVNFKGEVLRPLAVEDVERAIDVILSEGVQSVAVSLLHSYANPSHEEKIAERVRARMPNAILSVSSEVLPEMREYERTSTTVINAYVRPVVESYLRRLSDEMRAMGIKVPLTVMQSNGGLSTAELCMERPMYCIESGPAAGVVGAYHLGKRMGEENMMTLDMGGTTAKASIIEDGQMLHSPEYEVGGGMSIGHRLLKGAGYILRVPSIDIAEVGAGGGSIAWVDKGGSLQVGPQSAGAKPGPACYDLGGEDATVTDANTILGYVNPLALLGGTFPLKPEKGRKAVMDKVAKPMGLSEIEAAYGVHLLANSNMGRALRAVSSERGRDPRRFTLVVFGGGGPVHGAGLAEMLGITRIIVPPFPGVFSAFGLLFTDVEHHVVQTHFRAFSELDLDLVNGILERLWQQGRELLRQEGFEENYQQLITQVDMKYVGQTSEMTVPMPTRRLTQKGLEELGQAFEAEHEKTYGYRTDTPFQLVNLRVISRGISKVSRVPERIKPVGVTRVKKGERRKVYFGPKIGWVTAPIIDRSDLEGAPGSGPLLIEEYDSTTVVPSGWQASIDAWKNIIVSKV